MFEEDDFKDLTQEELDEITTVGELPEEMRLMLTKRLTDWVNSQI